jgi:hypothetical protein
MDFTWKAGKGLAVVDTIFMDLQRTVLGISGVVVTTVGVSISVFPVRTSCLDSKPYCIGTLPTLYEHFSYVI